MKKKHLLIGLTYASIFGFSFMASKRSMAYTFSPVHLVALRFLLAATVMTALWQCKVIKLDFSQIPWKLMIPLSLLQPLVYFCFEAIAINRLPSSLVGIMISMIPVVVMVLARIFLGERITKQQFSFIIMSVVGVIIINGVVIKDVDLLGLASVIVAVFAGAIFTVLSRKLKSPLETTFIIMIVGAIGFNGYSFVEHMIVGKQMDYFLPLTNLNSLLGILYLGILSSIVAFLLINYLLAHVEASKASVFNNVTTVVSMIAGVLFLGEMLTFVQILGALIVIISVYGIQKIQKNE